MFSQRNTDSFSSLHHFRSGFTLVELIIVISIIGVLATVIIPRMNSARDKAVDANIKAGTSILTESAEIYMDDNSSSYSGFCDSDAASTSLRAATSKSTTTIPGYRCYDGLDGWAAAVPLKSQNVVNSSSGQDYWCIERHTEGRIADTNLTVSSTTCP